MHTSKSPQVRRNSPALPARWCYDLFRALPGHRSAGLDFRDYSL